MSSAQSAAKSNKRPKSMGRELAQLQPRPKQTRNSVPSSNKVASPKQVAKQPDLPDLLARMLVLLQSETRPEHSFAVHDRAYLNNEERLPLRPEFLQEAGFCRNSRDSWKVKFPFPTSCIGKRGARFQSQRTRILPEGAWQVADLQSSKNSRKFAADRSEKRQRTNSHEQKQSACAQGQTH